MRRLIRGLFQYPLRTLGIGAALLLVGFYLIVIQIFPDDTLSTVGAVLIVAGYIALIIALAGGIGKYISRQRAKDQRQ